MINSGEPGCWRAGARSERKPRCDPMRRYKTIPCEGSGEEASAASASSASASASASSCWASRKKQERKTGGEKNPSRPLQNKHVSVQQPRERGRVRGEGGREGDREGGRERERGEGGMLGGGGARRFVSAPCVGSSAGHPHILGLYLFASPLTTAGPSQFGTLG